MKKWVTKSNSGVSQNRENLDVAHNIKVNKLIDGGFKVKSKDTDYSSLALANIDAETRGSDTMYTSQLKKSESELKSMSNYTANLVDVRNEMNQQLKDGTYSSGFVDAPLEWIARRISTGDYSLIANKSVDDIAKQMGMDTKLGRVLAERLKIYSGTAVADAEFKRVNEFMQGLSTMDEKQRAAAINAFTSEEVKSLERYSDSLAESGLPSVARKSYRKGSKDFKEIEAGKFEPTKENKVIINQSNANSYGIKFNY